MPVTVQPIKAGLIGIGLLGSAIAERLHHAGIQVLGWDLDGTKTAAAEQAGLLIGQAPREIARSCDRIMLCLTNSSASVRVIDQIEDSVRAGTSIADATTGDPASAVALAARLGCRGVDYSDACIGGSSADVLNRSAVVLFGGTPAAFTAFRPIFDCFAQTCFALGPAGAGTRMKLAFNLVLGLERAILAEGLSFAAAAGIAPEAALEVFKAGPAYSRVMDTKGQKMISHDFEPQARLSQHLKDVRLILEEGASSGARVPFTKLHRDILEELARNGLGDLDNSAVMRWFETR